MEQCLQWVEPSCKTSLLQKILTCFIVVLYRYGCYLVLLSKAVPHPDSLEIPMFFGGCVAKLYGVKY